jgi:REP-associated tyrosine transposase
MARPTRKTTGGYFYHVFNRANGRLRIFRKRDDFLAFERILGEAQKRTKMRICGYSIMSNHWHLLLRPYHDGDLSEFMRWLTVTHTMRYHYSHGTAGTGHVYQGRFKSFPIQHGQHLLSVLRYIEANPVRANVVENAADYHWSSYGRHIGEPERRREFELSGLAMKLPGDWERLVHKDISSPVAECIANSLKRGSPLGEKRWIKQTAEILDLQSTINRRGRPKKET